MLVMGGLFAIHQLVVDCRPSVADAEAPAAQAEKSENFKPNQAPVPADTA
jgi:hypothetical protein